MPDGRRQVILGEGPIGPAPHARPLAHGIDATPWSITGTSAYDMLAADPQRLDGADARVDRPAS